MFTRRAFLAASAMSLLARRRTFALQTPVITVYKDPSCQCCAKWVKHLSANGFVLMVQDTAKMDEIKRTLDVPANLQSCHTGVVNKYVIEGHVPADVIKKFLKEAPAALGLAVPGMPKGSPGMEGGTPDHYEILAFSRDGKTSVYAKR